jgi:plastocyanin
MRKTPRGITEFMERALLAYNLGELRNYVKGAFREGDAAMKRSILLTLLAAGLGVLVVAADAEARGRRGCRGGSGYAPAYYGPSAGYYMPGYYSSMPAYAAMPAYASPSQPQAAQQAVEVGAYDKEGFKPKSITVAPGTTVRWVNHGQERHTVTSRDGLFDSGPMAPGATYTYTFTRHGTFNYFCRPHEMMGMVGTVVVAAGGSGSTGSAPGY